MRCVSLKNLPLTTLMLSAFFLLGVLLGYAVSRRCADAMGGELRQYLDAYFALRSTQELSASAVWRTLVCFFRTPAVIFLLGFASLGVVLVPVLCALQGFLFSFSLFCFSSALGHEGFLLLPVLFGTRLLIVLPCTLLLGVAGWRRARACASVLHSDGKRCVGVFSDRQYWLRFGVVCVCLLLGAAIELRLVPYVLSIWPR